MNVAAIVDPNGVQPVWEHGTAEKNIRKRIGKRIRIGAKLTGSLIYTSNYTKCTLGTTRDVSMSPFHLASAESNTVPISKIPVHRGMPIIKDRQL